jgi:hypothetical protein
MRRVARERGGRAALWVRGACVALIAGASVAACGVDGAVLVLDLPVVDGGPDSGTDAGGSPDASDLSVGSADRATGDGRVRACRDPEKQAHLEDSWGSEVGVGPGGTSNRRQERPRRVRAKEGSAGGFS